MKRMLCFVVSLLVMGVMLSPNAGAKEAEPNDVLYKDLIITALTPVLNKEIENFYKIKYKEIPGFDYNTSAITKIERPNADRTSYFIIDVEIEPYFGPHITVGKDKIRIELKHPQEPKVINFKHMKDYQLPERYSSLYLR